MLIDSGASCDFIDKDFADRLGIPRWNLQHRINVRMANGSAISCSEVLPAVNVSVPGYTGAHDLIIMPALDGFDVVLGRPFLRSSGAIVNHADSSVTWHAQRATDHSHPQLAQLRLTNRGKLSVPAMTASNSQI